MFWECPIPQGTWAQARLRPTPPHGAEGATLQRMRAEAGGASTAGEARARRRWVGAGAQPTAPPIAIEGSLSPDNFSGHPRLYLLYLLISEGYMSCRCCRVCKVCGGPAPSKRLATGYWTHRKTCSDACYRAAAEAHGYAAASLMRKPGLLCKVCGAPTPSCRGGSGRWKHRKTCSAACLRVDVSQRFSAKPGHTPNRRKGSENPLWRGGLAASKKRAKAKYPERHRARKALSLAVKRGTILRQPCQECGDLKSEAHHEDYSKPREVLWLCLKHHREADRRLRERTAAPQQNP